MNQKAMLKAQQNELTGYNIYLELARKDTDENKELLLRIAKDELKHYEYWKKHTKQDVKPGPVWWYVFLSKIFGIVFLLKYMERKDQKLYGELAHKGIEKVIKDEEHHEMVLLSRYKEERLEYASSIVLGLNDALVELTGVLAGLTLALPSNRLIAIAGFVTGVAAAMSMAASAYFSAKEEQNTSKHPIKVAVYTGITYLVIVLMLIAPYVIFSNTYLSLATTLTIAVSVVAFYTFYISVAKGLPFWRRFLEMALVSIGVAVISFVLGYILNKYVGVSP